jgi:hypothetical protein
VVCVHHRDTMAAVAEMKHCGRYRRLSAFLYPDWHSARGRYENDLRLLREGIEAGRLTPPGDTPIPGASRQSLAAPAEPAVGAAGVSAAGPPRGGPAGAAPAEPPGPQPGG